MRIEYSKTPLLVGVIINDCYLILGMIEFILAGVGIMGSFIGSRAHQTVFTFSLTPVMSRLKEIGCVALCSSHHSLPYWPSQCTASSVNLQ